MKRHITLFIVLISIASHAQSDLNALLATSGPNASVKLANEKLQSILKPFSSSSLTGKKLLRKVFNRVESSLLKTYVAYSDFDDLFTSGRYDCLTATALFSQVLNGLSFRYEIIETNYHIFLVVNTTEGDVLIETTDRFGGFVTNKDAIEKRIGNYKNIVAKAGNSSNYFLSYNFSLYQQIAPEKLSGLLYFNQAVKAYNQKDWFASSRLLAKANSIYNSPRCNELGLLLIRTVVESEITEQAKAECLTYLKDFLMIASKNSRLIAAN